MTIIELCEQAEAAWREAGKAMKAIPGIGSGPMGLTPDHVKFSPAYRAAKAASDAAFAKLRKLNAIRNKINKLAPRRPGA